VPRHAQSAAAVAQLFCGPSFIDEVDYTVEKEEERFCYTVWIWTDAPNDLALEGKLQVEEPLVHSDEYLSRLGSMEERSSPVRDDPTATFDYKVFIHLDRVLDYNPLPDSPERMSFESVVTGIPADDPSASACPVRFDFTWCLGMRDGESLWRRMSVHDRLGGRGDQQDRPPPRGSDGVDGWVGFRQYPPTSWHDLRRGSSGHHWDGGAGTSSGHGGFGGRRFTAGASDANPAHWVWQPRKDGPKGKVSAVNMMVTEDSFLVRGREVQVSRHVDPMLEEAHEDLHPSARQPPRSLRLVEPTVTNAGQAVSSRVVGVLGPEADPVLAELRILSFVSDISAGMAQ
jgi:hypothetical protein